MGTGDPGISPYLCFPSLYSFLLPFLIPMPLSFLKLNNSSHSLAVYDIRALLSALPYDKNINLVVKILYRSSVNCFLWPRKGDSATTIAAACYME